MKNIIITGAASGIGRATAGFFARRGWYVGLFDTDEKGLASLAADLGKDHCCYCHMDVSDYSSVERGMSYFVEKGGRAINVLFNNAGILKMGFFEDLSLGEQIMEVDVNLKGVIHCTYAALPYLKTTRGSRVINMSSASAIHGAAHLAVYSATKAAVSSLAESLNMELESLGIHFCDIRVPYVQTPLLDATTKAASLETLGARLLPEDVARLVYNSLKGRKVHYDGKGMKPLLLLQRLAPAAIQKIVLRAVMMP